jgi:hypothetical protein
MHRHQRHPQVPRGQHHDRSACAVVTRRSREVAEELGVAGEFEARGVERRLGDRRRDHAGDFTAQRQADGGFDPLDDRSRGRRRRLAGDDPRLQRQVQDRQDVGEQARGFVRGGDPAKDRGSRR